MRINGIGEITLASAKATIDLIFQDFVNDWSFEHRWTLFWESNFLFALIPTLSGRIHLWIINLLFFFSLSPGQSRLNFFTAQKLFRFFEKALHFCLSVSMILRRYVWGRISIEGDVRRKSCYPNINLKGFFFNDILYMYQLE